MLLTATRIAQLVELQDFDTMVGGSDPLCAIIVLPTMFASWQMPLQLKAHNHNGWSMKNQVDYTGFETRVRIFSFFLSCLNRISPALVGLRTTSNGWIIESRIWSTLFISSYYRIMHINFKDFFFAYKKASYQSYIPMSPRSKQHTCFLFWYTFICPISKHLFK